MIRVLFIACVAIAAAMPAAARHLSDTEISEFGGCYFAPITSGGIWRMRTQDGEMREFEVAGGKSGRLVGVGGWWAEPKKGGEVSVHAPATGEYPPLVYNFKNGRLASLDVEGRHCRFGYPNPIVYDDEVIFPLWPDAKETTAEEFAKNSTMWKDGRRLRLWFASPNQAGAFVSFALLLFLGLASSRRLNRFLRAAALALAVVAFAALVWTASRGAILGACLGGMAMAVCDSRIRTWFTWRRLAISVAVFAVFAALAVFAMYSGARDTRTDAKSDATRMETFRAVPAMMFASPCGWGDFSDVGKAYSYWFSTDSNIRLNLVSDHLTMLVGHGWIGGSVYVFTWLASLALLAVFARRGGSSIPLGMWVSLCVAASLNVVLFAPTMLWVPCAALSFLVFDRRWLKLRTLLASAAFGVVAALLAMASLWAASKCIVRQTPSIHKDGDRMLVNGKNPDIWIVDDGEALGGVLAPRDICDFYRRFPNAPAIGYVKDVTDVPQTGVKRLVLVGDSAQYFMVPYSQDPKSVRVPPQLIFLAPQFPPSAIPDTLRAQSRVIMVIGEFAARYWGEYAKPHDWIGIIPGAEVYIPGWMAQCVEQDGRRP